MSSLRVYFYKHTDGFVDSLIHVWTNSPYSHCALVLTSDDEVSVLYEAANGVGVRSRVVIPEIDLRPADWDYIEVPATPEAQELIRDWVLGEIGCKYDWCGLFLSQVLFIPRSHPDKWFCSEFAAAALELLGLLYGAKPCTFSPGSLWRVTRGPCG